MEKFSNHLEKHKNAPENPSTSTINRALWLERSNVQPHGILGQEDWLFWMENGFVIIKDAVPQVQAKKLADYLWKYEGKDPNDMESWYSKPNAPIQMKELTNTGMVEIYQHQYLWDNRQYPKVHQAFADIWGTNKLWVTIDRANLNFPIRKGFEHSGFIHWDHDPETDEHHVQGVLALEDQMDENMGGFQCIPALYRTYDTWKLTQPEGRDPFQPDTKGFEILKISLKAGDLLIFNSRLPHGIRPNLSKDKVRIAQYISMMPAQDDNEMLLQWRINSWKNKLAPEGYAFPGDPLEREKKDQVAKLTELGEKLLGLKKW